MKRPRLLLLDANAVIAALEAGVWEPLAAAYEVILPATVLRVELIHYRDPATGRQASIDGATWVDDGTVTEVEVETSDLQRTLARFREPFRSNLDDGETEAIAYLLNTGEEDGIAFVTADGWAIQAVAMLGLSARAMCLSDALARCGHGKKLPRHHTEEFLREHLKRGGQRLVTGDGLA